MIEVLGDLAPPVATGGNSKLQLHCFKRSLSIDLARNEAAPLSGWIAMKVNSR